MILRASAMAGFDCASWESRAFSTSTSNARDGRFDQSSVALELGDEQAAGLFGRRREALLRYEIFPPSRLRYRVCTNDGVVAPGATIVQQLLLGLCVLESGVRVLDVVESEAATERRVGFSYATLEGHPERGIASFWLRHELLTGRLSFSIETWSRPGTWITMIGAPVARLIQKQLTAAAMARFQAV